MNLATNALKALVQWPFTKRTVKNPRLVMTLLVKNEEEKLEANLRFHHAMGVDAFVVTDNNSTDGTRDILRRYQEKGWIETIIEEHSTGYEQKRWVDRMIQIARKQLHADWIINADADEFWYAPSGNLKDEMAGCTQRVLLCRVFSMYPEEGKPFSQWTHRIIPVTDQQSYDLSPYSIFERQNFKVAHRADGYIQISMGNHKVKTFPATHRISNMVVYHYNVGSRQAFVQKMVNGGRELELHRGRHGGRHWRYFYQLWKEGRLEEEYDRVIGRGCYERLVADGHIVPDSAVCDVLQRIYENENI